LPRNARTHGRSHPDGGRQQLHHLHWQSQDGAELPPARPQRERAAGVDHSPGAGQAPEDGCEENVRIRHQSGAGRLDTEHPAVSVTPCGRCRQPDAGPIVLRRRVRPPPKSNRCHTSVFTCCGILPKHGDDDACLFPKRFAVRRTEGGAGKRGGCCPPNSARTSATPPPSRPPYITCPPAAGACRRRRT